MNWKILSRSLLISLWFAVLTTPILVMQVNDPDGFVVWRWQRLIFIILASLILSYLGQLLQTPPAIRTLKRIQSWSETILTGIRKGISRKTLIIIFSCLSILLCLYPFLVSLYYIRIVISTLIFLILALGLNVMVGLGGLLNLGYAAFFAVGAYTYALLNNYLGIGFWAALPVAVLTSTVCGILIAIPVLNLRGDYLAIITLAFGEIVRIVLLNWSEFTNGPRGIAGIPAPGLFGIQFNLLQSNQYTYFVVIAVLLLLVFIVRRLEDSRIGRSWEASREDHIAGEAMGINMAVTKITIFAVSSCIAGIAGVLFAGSVNFINPSSFTVWQSIIILCIIVLGGMGSIPGAVLGAVMLVLLPEYLRFLSNYRLLVFGAILVIMMQFRPGGLIQKKRKIYTVENTQ